MRYTTDEHGILNNFAVEPQMYLAEPPTKSQKIKYGVQALCSTALIAVIGWVAFLAS
jgi:hypothetical protein